MIRKLFFLIFIMCVTHLNAVADDCGSLRNHYGPYDYTNPTHVKEYLPIVEVAHFNRRVESLKGGARASGNLLFDLDYTLRAFPNHHRALYAIMRYREKNPWTPGQQSRSAECYFQRALTFKSDDGVVWMLYGIYKHRAKKYKEALAKYKNAEKLLKNNTDLYYNMGLLYFDMGEIEMAQRYAKLAYDRGYPLPALKNKLKGLEDAE